MSRITVKVRGGEVIGHVYATIPATYLRVVTFLAWLAIAGLFAVAQLNYVGPGLPRDAMLVASGICLALWILSACLQLGTDERDTVQVAALHGRTWTAHDA